MQMHVEIEFMTRGKEVVAQALRQALQEAWKALPPRAIRFIDREHGRSSQSMHSI